MTDVILDTKPIGVAAIEACAAEVNDPLCDCIGAVAPEISSKMTHGWGGARPNSGGPRPNSGGARPGAGRKPKHVAQPEPHAWIGPRWCVVLTHSQAERLAVHEMSRSGYTAYLPLTACRRRDRVVPTMWHKVLVPRLPGYVFAQLGPTDPWWPILHLPGVRGVLLNTAGTRPMPTGIGEVERLQDDDAAQCELPDETMTPFDAGAVVKILQGALAGRTGIVAECDGMRTRIEAEAFGRVVPIWVSRADVVAAT